MKITKSQLKEIIKEEVSRLQKKTILENRKKEIVRELRMLNEEVTKEQIKSIVLKHNKDFYDVEDELSDNDLEIDVYDGHPSERGVFNIIDSSGDVITSGKVEDEKITEIDKDYLLNEEDASDSTLEQIKDLLRDNKFLADKADSLSGDIVKDVDSSIYLQFPNELDSPHIKKHFDKSGPASVWSISKDAVGDLILKTIKTKPTKTGQEGPAFKHKWLNVDSGKNIGFDSLKKVDGEIESTVDLEPFGMVDRVKDWSVVSKVASDNNYELVTKDQKPYTEENLKNNEPAFIKQNVGVFYGDKTENPTSIFNVVLAKIGEVNNKPVLTLMTVFPGINPVDGSGNDITNKKDLIKHGYALIKPKSDVNESIRKIVREGIFSILNENVSNKIESIADKHCDGDFNWWNLMEDIKTALKEHFKNCNCSIKDLPDTDDSCGIEIAKGDRSVPLMLKYDDDRGENIIKIVCKDSDETYNYEILSWENSGGESRGYDAFGYEDITYEEEGVDCDVKNNIIEELITDIEEYLDKKHNSIK